MYTWTTDKPLTLVYAIKLRHAKHAQTTMPLFYLKLSQLTKAPCLLVMDGVARGAQNLVVLLMLDQLSALAFSVASVAKRLLVILTAIVFFSTPASPTIYFGLILAVTGLLLFNLVRLSSPYMVFFYKVKIVFP